MKKLFLLMALLATVAMSAQINVDRTGGHIYDGYPTTALDALSNPRKGMVVRDSTLNTLVYYDGTAFVTLGGVSIDASGFNGNLSTADDTVQEVAQAFDDLLDSTLDSPYTPANYTRASSTVRGQIQGIDTALGLLGEGDVTGPASATDNAIAVYNGTTGKLLKNSPITITEGSPDQIDFSFADLVNVRSITTNVSVETSFLESQDFKAIPTDIEPTSEKGRYYMDDSESRLKLHNGTGFEALAFESDLATAGTDDQTASEVPITDTADNYPTDNVEAALAELATNSLTTSDIGVNVQAYSPDLDLVDGTNTGDETEATIKTKIAAGTGFDDAHIADGGISPVKLSADNSPTDDSDLTYESSTGNVVYATNRVKSNTTGLSNAVQITNIVAGNEADVSGWAVDANRLDVILDKKLIQEREIYLGAKGVDIETGTSVEIWPVFDAITITEVAAFSGTAPTGSTAIFDINEDGVSILSTNLSIDATEKWSSTATSTAVISDTTVDANSVISFDIDQVGSTVPGTDVVIKIKYYLN